MENIKIVIAIIASFLILFAYLRFITDEDGNVPLNNYRFTGALNLVIRDMFEGTTELFGFKISGDGLSALAMYFGLIMFFIAFSY